jgi:hypothetical protein
MTGMMMPETCWDTNKYIIFCISLVSYSPSWFKMHGHMKLKFGIYKLPKIRKILVSSYTRWSCPRWGLFSFRTSASVDQSTRRNTPPEDYPSARPLC